MTPFGRELLLKVRLLLLSLLDLVINLTAVDRHVLGGIDPKPHLVTPYFNHGDDDIITDDNGFVRFAGQDEHGSTFGVIEYFPR